MSDRPSVPEWIPRHRKCDCGCRRPVVFYLEEWDLGFGLRCEHLYLGAVEAQARLQAEVQEALDFLYDGWDHWAQPSEAVR